MAKFGLTSWNESANTFKPGQNNGGQGNLVKIPFLKLVAGPNRVRVITAPYKYYQISFKLSPEDTTNGKFGKSIKCSDPLKDCPTRKAGFKAKDHWYVGVIDRADGQIKIADIKSSIYNPLNEFYTDIELGDLKGYDVVIKKNPGAAPANYYTVIPRDKQPLSPGDLKLIADIGDNLTNTLERLSKPPTAEQVIERMKEAGWDGESLLVQPKPKKDAKPELNETSEDDYSFSNDSSNGQAPF